MDRNGFLAKVLTVGAALLALTGSAGAATLVTPPLDGYDLNTGKAVCAIYNTGKTTAQFSYTMTTPSGTNILSFGPLTLPPVYGYQSPLEDLSVHSPAICTFTVSNKKNFRASMNYITPYGVTVIPAQ
jgi:hypothetical protein